MKEALALLEAINKLSRTFGISISEATENINSVMQSAFILSQSLKDLGPSAPTIQVAEDIADRIIIKDLILPERKLTLLGTQTIVSSNQKGDLEKISQKDNFEDFEIKITSMKTDFEKVIEELRKEDYYDIN